MECFFKWCEPATETMMKGGYKKVLGACPGHTLRSIRRYFDDFKKQRRAGVQSPPLTNKRHGRAGTRNKLTPELRAAYLAIGQEHAQLWIRLTRRLLQAELESRGHHLSLLSTIHSHLKLMKAVEVNLRIKPLLTQDHKNRRMRFILNKANRAHGLNRPEHYWK